MKFLLCLTLDNKRSEKRHEFLDKLARGYLILSSSQRREMRDAKVSNFIKKLIEVLYRASSSSDI